jgi:nitroreductase
MKYNKPVTELMKQRYSCRHYLDTLIDDERRRLLKEFLESCRTGPFGTPVRFGLIAATEQDMSALRGLGTYGTIKGATAFFVGAAGPGPKNLEDWGYLMEAIILFATDLGLGTCWLGGTFTKSRFARRLGLGENEQMPAAVSLGFDARQPYIPDAISRRVAGSHRRLPWQNLFFDGDSGEPLSAEAAGDYATALEMVRLGPSASNKQPWRIVRTGPNWHFYIQRALVYRPWTLGLAGVADMPRLDIGIAMCHFELTAREMGLPGSWQTLAPDPPPAAVRAEYSATWVAAE